LSVPKAIPVLHVQGLVLQCEGTVYCSDLVTSLPSVPLSVTNTVKQRPYCETDRLTSRQHTLRLLQKIRETININTIIFLFKTHLSRLSPNPWLEVTTWASHGLLSITL
jgi:hypothetical protein